MMRKGLVFIVVFMAGVLSGCQTVQEVKESVGLAKTADPTLDVREFGDIPVPEGYTFQKQRSFRHHTNYQASRLVYSKTTMIAKLQPLVDYYENELPRHGWVVRFVYGRRTRYVYATKGQESCEVTLAAKYNKNQTLIVIRRSKDSPDLAMK